MVTYETAFARELEKMINDAILRISNELATGWSVRDYPEYRYKVGQIEGLKAVLEAFDEAEDNAKKR